MAARKGCTGEEGSVTHSKPHRTSVGQTWVKRWVEDEHWQAINSLLTLQGWVFGQRGTIRLSFVGVVVPGVEILAVLNEGSMGLVSENRGSQQSEQCASVENIIQRQSKLAK